MAEPPIYSADRAANVVIGMAVVAAIICVVAGVLQLRGGSAIGWLLIVLGLVPLAAAFGVRRSIGRPRR